MAFASDSRYPGYLGPIAGSPQPLTDDAFDDFLHDVIAGVTGMDPTLVRPRWQTEPPNMPDFGVDWVTFGIISIGVDFEPAVIHFPDPDGLGHDMLQEHEVDTIMCSFFGPHAQRYSSLLRRGLYVSQNRAVLRANAVGLVEITDPQVAPELIKNRWLNRIDTNLVLRREIRYDYKVGTLLRAMGPIIGNDREERVITTDFDTDEVP